MGSVSHGSGDLGETASLEAQATYDTGYRKEDFCYFWRLFEMPGNCGSLPTDDDWDLNGWGTQMPDDGILSGGSAVSGRYSTGSGTEIYYFDGGGTQTLNFDGSGIGAFNVASGEKVVVFVNGNLQFANLDGSPGVLDVADGGFISFIVKGDVRFPSSVGRDAGGYGLPVVEGVFIADGSIDIQGGSRQFVGEGMFVGHTDVSIHPNRDLSGTGNNTDPAAYFVYRPDFLLNAPEEFERSNFEWREIAPF